MDIKVSHKEWRMQPSGPAEVLTSNVCDIHPLFADSYDEKTVFTGYNGPREYLLADVEILDDPYAERLDRAMFALMKQRGADPTELDDGIQWGEAVIGEVLAPSIIQQGHIGIMEEGRGIQATAYTVKNGDKENLVFEVGLTGMA